MSSIELFQSKTDCCGCSACYNVCPRKAISMQKDEYGYVYPVIDQDKCVGCGLCRKVCHYQADKELRTPIKAYAAAGKKEEFLKKAASGGMFSLVADKILEEGGVVFGASMEYHNNTLIPKHIAVESKEELFKLQGSKYVQSFIGNTYAETKKYLADGRKVLFSGTPCQIEGLKGYLGREYENLYTIDIICHGVPNAKWFQDYIKVFETKLQGSIYSYNFRDKSRGQGMNARIEYYDKNGKAKVIYRDGHLTSFFHLFLKMNIYRDNCYHCPYARKERAADITIGDYWGIYEEHADEMKNSTMSNSKGISCVLLNSDKGLKIFEQLMPQMDYFESTVDKIAKHNMQLREPTQYTDERFKLFDLYKNAGYEGIEKYFRKSIRFKKYFYQLRSMAPKGLKRKLKQMIAKVRG